MRHVKFALLMLSLALGAQAQETTNPVWTLSPGEGPAIATFAPVGGPPLVSVGCDKAAAEIVIFRAASDPAGQIELTLSTETGQLRLAATADPSGTPGLIARAPVADPFIEQLASAATVTFGVAGEDGDTSGISAPVEEPLRQVIKDCAG
jgi:hypothetical protein